MVVWGSTTAAQSFTKQRYMAILMSHAIYQNMALPIYEPMRFPALHGEANVLKGRDPAAATSIMNNIRDYIFLF